MKLMDKIKDLFMDEVIDDDELELEEEEKEEYREPPKEERKTFPKEMRESIEKEEKLSFRTKPEERKTPVIEGLNKREEEPVKKVEEPVKKFNFPIDFEEEVTKAERKEVIPPKKEVIPPRQDNIPSRKEWNSYREIEDSIKNTSLGNGNVNVLNLERETPKKVSELYPKKEEPKSKFKASPVISPVYGVLDKNYTKEEVREKTDDTNTMKRPSKKVDFETVRKKAFGNLADEIKDNLLCENCELYKEVKKISALTEDDLLYDMTVDEEADKEVTIEKAYDNYRDFGVAYEPKPVKKKVEPEPVPEEEEKEFELPKELEGIINNNNNNVVEEDEEEGKEEFVPQINKIETEITIKKTEVAVEPEEEKEEPKEEKIPTREEKKKEAKVDDDFFELIDSMYKERIDD